MALEDKQHAEAVRSRIDMIVDAQEMRGGASVPVVRRKPFNAKILIWVLSVMGVVIVGLVAAILLVVKPWEYYEEGDSRIVKLCYYSSKTTSDLVKCVEENHGEDNILDSYREIIAKRISKIDDYTVAAAADAYEDIINVLDDEDQVELLMDRIRWISINDESNELGDVAIRDALTVYRLDPNATYANTVMAVAEKYGYEDIYEEYKTIYDAYMEEYMSEGGIG